LREFQHYSKISDAQLIDGTTLTAPVFGHWMTVILMANAELRVTVKAFYGGTCGRKLMAFKSKKPAHTVNPRWISDYMKELLNLTCGAVKRELIALDCNVGLSLPLEMRGFDELFAEDRDSSASYSSYLWTIKTEHGPLVFRAEIEALDTEYVANLCWAPQPESADADMEFL